MTDTPTLSSTNSSNHSSMSGTSTTSNGALRTITITLWIIVLTWTVLSMAMTLGSV